MQVEFYVTSKAVAAGVAVETFLPGHFSDNAMHIRPEHPKQLCFTSAAGPITAARLQETLTMQVVSPALHPAARLPTSYLPVWQRFAPSPPYLERTNQKLTSLPLFLAVTVHTGRQW